MQSHLYHVNFLQNGVNLKSYCKSRKTTRKYLNIGGAGVGAKTIPSYVMLCCGFVPRRGTGALQH